MIFGESLCLYFSNLTVLKQGIWIWCQPQSIPAIPSYYSGQHTSLDLRTHIEILLMIHHKSSGKTLQSIIWIFLLKKVFKKIKYRLQDGHSADLANIGLIESITSALDDSKSPITVTVCLSEALDPLDNGILVLKNTLLWVISCCSCLILIEYVELLELNT